MIPPQPRSTLFPYTTLFRSQAQFISKVPISISAFSQQSMDSKGMKSFNEVARFTPGVRFNSDGNQISIRGISRSEEHTSELQSRGHLVCRLLLEKKKKEYIY